MHFHIQNGSLTHTHSVTTISKRPAILVMSDQYYFLLLVINVFITAKAHLWHWWTSLDIWRDQIFEQWRLSTRELHHNISHACRNYICNLEDCSKIKSWKQFCVDVTNPSQLRESALRHIHHQYTCSTWRQLASPGNGDAGCGNNPDSTPSNIELCVAESTLQKATDPWRSQLYRHVHVTMHRPLRAPLSSHAYARLDVFWVFCRDQAQYIKWMRNQALRNRTSETKALETESWACNLRLWRVAHTTMKQLNPRSVTIRHTP